MTEGEPERTKENAKQVRTSIGSQVRRPGWVVAAAIWLVLVALIWVWSGASALAQIAQIDWAANAARLEVEASALKSIYTTDAYGMLAVGVLMMGSIVGIWLMKKWGAVAYLAVVSFLTVGQVFLVIQGGTDLIQILLSASLILIGFGLIWLWRGGELT